MDRLKSVYLRFLIRLVIKIIKKHFHHGLVQEDGWNAWRWTEELEQDLFRQ